jgi:hypothetical protein
LPIFFVRVFASINFLGVPSELHLYLVLRPPQISNVAISQIEEAKPIGKAHDQPSMDPVVLEAFLA